MTNNLDDTRTSSAIYDAALEPGRHADIADIDPGREHDRNEVRRIDTRHGEFGNEETQLRENGEPALEEHLNAAKEAIQGMERMYVSMYKQKQEVQEQLYQINQLLTKYAFGSPAFQQMDYQKMLGVLEACPTVAQDAVRRAANDLESFMVGLPAHKPLTGLQLYMEAVTRPEDFNSTMLLAFLRNSHPLEYGNFGFLWLVVEALLDVPTASIRGFRALAVLDLLQIWMHIDPSQNEKINKYLDLYREKAPAISMSTASTFDAFTENAHRCLREVIRYHGSHVPNRGQEMLENIVAFPNLQSHIISMDQTTLTVNDGGKGYPNVLMSLTSNPTYLIHVEDGRVSWLRPEQVTVRVDVSQDAVFIHDNQEPHLMPQKQLSLGGLDLEYVCGVLGDVEYLD